MPRYDVLCPAGHRREIVARWDDRAVPCPDCQQTTERVWSAPAVQSDQLANPWIEHLDHEPVYCETKQDLQREMDRRGLRLRDQWVPGDRHLTNWAAGIDAYTLESAALLLSRGSRTAEAPPLGQLETLKTEIREMKTWDL